MLAEMRLQVSLPYVCETDQQPRKPDQRGGQPDTLGLEQTTKMHDDFCRGVSSFGMSRDAASASRLGARQSASLHSLERKRTRSIVLLRNSLQGLHNFFVPALPDQEFWCFVEANDGNT